MRIEKLRLTNFKNYQDVNLDLTSKINVLVGRNGSGKTNLLDAIYYLSFTKSAFNASDHQNIRHEQNHFYINGQLTIDSKPREISCGVQIGLKKSFREENIEYQKLSEHIGKYPIVFLAPDDVDLVKEGSESRRRFFDSMISQIDKIYLDSLIRYNHCLKQRNSLLKMFSESGQVDWNAIESYDHVLEPLGQSIYNRRKAFVHEFIPIFRKFFTFLVEDKETTDVRYSSGLSDVKFIEGLFKNRNRDLALQRTNFGTHRDEYEFALGTGDLKRLGSQGQQKSFVIALKLAQAEVLKSHKGFSPILLLDDIFDKLDDDRIAKLLELIKNDLGQLFITDARPDRTQGLLQQINVSASFFSVENGKIMRHE